MTSEADDGQETNGESLLNTSEQVALQMVAAGISHAEVGSAVGRSAKWTQRLLRRPEAQRFVADCQRARLQEVSGILTEAAVEAATVMKLELWGETPALRLRAAGMALSHVEALQAALEMTTAIADLRDQIAELRSQLDVEK